MKRLVAGPWVGEFGWELMSWQGLVRKAARSYDEVYVCAPSGHEALYADFSPVFIPHDLCGTRDCWRLENPVNKFGLQPTLEMLRRLGGDLMSPYGLVPTTAQRFVHYGDPDRVSDAEACDILIHARMPIGKKPYHSWSEENWKHVIRTLAGRFSIGSIGTQAYVFHDLPIKNYGGVGLQKLMDLMACARLVVGPSSGPMHLASLVSTPHLVWTDDAQYSAIGCTNRRRYEKVWNPFQTRVTVMDTGWQPEPKSVVDAILRELA